MTNQNTALPSLVTCLAVRLTDSTSENLNMEILHVKATAEAPATAIKRTLVGGYEVFSRFTSGNGLPLLTTLSARLQVLRGKPYGSLAKATVAAVNPHTTCRMGFQFFSPNEM